jgi:hypothetical protein
MLVRNHRPRGRSAYGLAFEQLQIERLRRDCRCSLRIEETAAPSLNKNQIRPPCVPAARAADSCLAGRGEGHGG